MPHASYKIYHNLNNPINQVKKTMQPAADLAQPRSPRSGERGALA